MTAFSLRILPLQPHEALVGQPPSIRKVVLLLRLSGNSEVKYKYLNYIKIYSFTRVLKFEGKKKKKESAVSPI